MDAWWEEREERQDALEVLGALLADFRQGKERIVNRRKSSILIQNSINELLIASYDPDSQLEPASLDQHLGNITWWFPGGQIPTGALNYLTYGGKLNIVQNEELRLDIADWRRKIDDLQGGLRQDYDVFLEVYMPYLRENDYLPQIANSVTQIPGEASPFYQTLPPAPKQVVDNSPILTDRRFHNILIQMWWVQADAQALLDETNQWLDVNIQLVEEQLDL